ncbi:MAG: type II toxin-antitoxin system Phd/YefM family antitoxin [Syntrophorhabdaceae bacterium]|nr:type II toxin-antitoxin system Phd/YefM family antitoxin [Syntrophorhabdaceae bacterium]
MKIVSAKELRIKTSAILEETRKGNEVIITLRGKPAAVLKPIEKEDRSFKHIGFGLWKDREDMKDPGIWVSERRNERKGPAGTV